MYYLPLNPPPSLPHVSCNIVNHSCTYVALEMQKVYHTCRQSCTTLCILTWKWGVDRWANRNEGLPQRGEGSSLGDCCGSSLGDCCCGVSDVCCWVWCVLKIKSYPLLANISIDSKWARAQTNRTGINMRAKAHLYACVLVFHCHAPHDYVKIECARCMIALIRLIVNHKLLYAESTNQVW